MSYRAEKRYQALNRRQTDEMLGQKSTVRPSYSPRKQVAASSPSLPSKREAKRWFNANVESFFDCGEVQCTQMVEGFCVEYPQCDHWLDDDTHWIWDIPVDIEASLEELG